ncbi:MAG TPA: non-canonical purine NTP pyrophosphatase, RdgB/HAM1 family [Gammaproteobacteria bacterium]|nr:non-canonical purine NTP pyrophosphatase, RdgB/HAM1 family [Gammaproteobacteria bacterium]
MTKLVLASRNRGKLEDFRLLFADLGIELFSVADFSDQDVEETASTFVENALLKARHASALSGLPALADDSGLVVAALKGAPGIHSARYAGSHGDDAANNRKLLAEMEGLAGSNRRAHFHCTLVVVGSDSDPAPVIAEGRWYGVVGEQPVGNGGFGYDPLFVPAGSTRSVAQLSADEKNRLSHRGQAVKQLLTLI